MFKEYVYLDNNATTPVDPRVMEAVMPYFTNLYGNAASNHSMGRTIQNLINKARGQVGDLIDANEEDIYFTAGATEAINLALRGLPTIGDLPMHIITVQTEHPAVLDTCRHLEATGVEVTYLSVDKQGLIDLSELESAFRPNTVLVCVMLVNSETGVIQDINRIAEITHDRGSLFMTDATQGVGKLPLSVSDGIDILTFSAHKFYGIKGIGGLYVNPRLKLKPLIFGGGHERGLRSGTLNVPGVIGLGVAAAIAAGEMDADSKRVGALRDRLENLLLLAGGGIVNGSQQARIYNTSNIRFEGIDNNALLLNLKDICVSNGSACHSFVMEPSHVLTAMGLTKKEANTSVRFSLGRFNTEQDVSTAAHAVNEAIVRLRAMGG